MFLFPEKPPPHLLPSPTIFLASSETLQELQMLSYLTAIERVKVKIQGKEVGFNISNSNEDLVMILTATMFESTLL